MAITLDCSCGARFETDAPPGQTLVCPDCDRPLTVRAHNGVRTSGLALASVIVGLVGLFTVVLTVLASLMGLAALVSIARRRDELAGAGYAVFGIVVGVIFTPLSLFAYSKAELFEGMRDRLLARAVDRSGPLEIMRPREGYAITRPSERWGVARGTLAEDIIVHRDSLVLAHASRDVWIEVSVHDVSQWQSLEESQEEVLNWFRPFGRTHKPRFLSELVERSNRRLPDQHGLEALEMVFEFREGNKRLTNLVRILKRRGGSRLFVIRGLAENPRFLSMEAEIRQAQNSFRPLRP